MEAGNRQSRTWKLHPGILSRSTGIFSFGTVLRLRNLVSRRKRRTSILLVSDFSGMETGWKPIP